MPRKTAREGTAIHEAGHIVAGRKKGAKQLKGYVAPDGKGGHFTGKFGGSKEVEAVILAAGGIAQKKFTGWGGPSRDDQEQIKKLLRKSKATPGDIQRQAEALVSQNKRAIAKEAKRLLRQK